MHESMPLCGTNVYMYTHTESLWSYRLREIVGIGTIKTLASVVFYSCFAAGRAFSLLNASYFLIECFSWSLPSKYIR